MSAFGSKSGHRRVSFIRKRGQYLGTVEAPRVTEAAAVAEFDLRDARRRLVVSEGITLPHPHSDEGFALVQLAADRAPICPAEDRQKKLLAGFAALATRTGVH